MIPPLFGILQLDKGEPYGYAQLPGLVESWTQDAGGFACVGLVVYILYALRIPTDKSQSERLRVPLTMSMTVLAALSLICYALVALTVVLEYRGVRTFSLGGRVVPLFAPPPQVLPIGMAMKPVPPEFHAEVRPLLMVLGGALALLGLLQPFIRDAFKLRLRRVGALTKLSFKEALRIRLHWVFLLVFLPYMFRGVWMSRNPIDEVRSLVGVSTLAVTFLVISTAGLLSAFSIPNDIKNFTIHTVVTKPVERFEIVLGRFFGYAALMTLSLAALTAVNLVLIDATRFNETAAEQTLKARVPVRGKLDFRSRNEKFVSTNVGREFEYRKYIVGHPSSPQRAVWSFPALPSALGRAAGDAVPVEYTFDIYRMTKGKEDRGGSGVDISLRFVTRNCPQKRPGALREGDNGEWRWADPLRQEAYEKELARLRERGLNPGSAEPGTPAWEAANALAEEYGFFEVRGKPLYNNRVMGVHVPAGLARNALANAPNDSNEPLLQAFVKCESGGQMVGVAEPDLYLLAATQTFSQNYAKGMFGVWCQVCLVIGLGVACSTYLSGIIAFLTTAFLYLAGYFTEAIQDVALNRNIGGGPFEALSHIVKAEVPTPLRPDGPGADVLLFLDRFWAWVIRRFQNFVPDVESFGWSNFVSEGYNVDGEYLAVNFLVLLGYLIPWAILAYYLMKSREIASS